MTSGQTQEEKTQIQMSVHQYLPFILHWCFLSIQISDEFLSYTDTDHKIALLLPDWCGASGKKWKQNKCWRDRGHH
jgi:hypothetical protein